MSLFYCTFSYAVEIGDDAEFELFIEKEEIIDDPFEDVNRAIFKFNTAVDKAIFYPIAKDYSGIKSQFISGLIEQFSSNLHEPSNFINAILQGKLEIAANAFWRFYINAILGLGGVFEIAEPLGISKAKLGFEDTMIFYGVKKGPYVVLPFDSPSSLRHAFASVLEIFVNPLFYIINNIYVSCAVHFALLIPKREELLDLDVWSGIDPYAKWRSIFSQKASYEAS